MPLNWQTPVDGKFADARLVPGCWIESKRFGLCVLISIHDDYVDLRYEGYHLQTQEKIWVGSCDSEVVFRKHPNDESREVLALEGPYGLGVDRSDPRMP